MEIKTANLSNQSSNLPTSQQNKFSIPNDKSSEENSASENSFYDSSNENNKEDSECENFKSNLNMREFIANEKKGKSIHSKFLYLKKQLNLGHFMRKTQIDSLLKKCKSKAFKNIHDALSKCLKIKLGRLPQLFITNIKIDFNKYYLSKTILEIYREFNIIESLDDLVSKGNIVENRKKILEDFLNMSLKQVYEYYINSHQFKKDYLQVTEKEGQNFAILFSYIAQIFIQYYQKSRGNKRKCIINKNNKNSVDDIDKENNIHFNGNNDDFSGKENDQTNN